MLTLADVTVRLGGFTLRADLDVPPGGITAVIGPSGSGKSTVLNAIAGFVALSAGRVSIAGRDVTDAAPGARPVSIIFQDQNLFPHLTVARNVGLGLRTRGRPTPEERDSVDAVLARVGLEGTGDRRPADLSGGQQSRAALARALLRRRPWLLLDEAFGALGPALRHEMLDLLSETAAEAGLSALMVTHDPNDVRRAAGRTILVADGVAHPPVRTEALFADPPEALKAYLGPRAGT
ncbi:ATP-binding cassette domain-containing protein [Jannaschia sp. LMIT008]|uniref:thiamine ABC transporter ATP-binding protein n=1 Tax=Jannaschia maritima TaxID=3032585 RepID=UPI002811419C|nr:ATP-binding cassette domain-containing protein [Jannaschia sp. LMIT008]